MSKDKKKNLEEEIKKNNSEKSIDEELEGETETMKEDSSEKIQNDKEDMNDEESQSEGDSQSEQSEDFKNQYICLMADFQNFRKRTEKEKSDIYAYANEKIVFDMLDVLDNFERAIDAAEKVEKSDGSESFFEGMKMILKQMLDVLRKHDVKEIEALGQDFDPNFHSAVMMEDNPDFESGKVTFVMQKGYMLNDRVIRPAMVKVAN